MINVARAERFITLLCHLTLQLFGSVWGISAGVKFVGRVSYTVTTAAAHVEYMVRI